MPARRMAPVRAAFKSTTRRVTGSRRTLKGLQHKHRWRWRHDRWPSCNLSPGRVGNRRRSHSEINCWFLEGRLDWLRQMVLSRAPRRMDRAWGKRATYLIGPEFVWAGVLGRRRTGHRIS